MRHCPAILTMPAKYGTAVRKGTSTKEPFFRHVQRYRTSAYMHGTFGRDKCETL